MLNAQKNYFNWRIYSYKEISFKRVNFSLLSMLDSNIYAKYTEKWFQLEKLFQYSYKEKVNFSLLSKLDSNIYAKCTEKWSRFQTRQILFKSLTEKKKRTVLVNEKRTKLNILLLSTRSQNQEHSKESNWLRFSTIWFTILNLYLGFSDSQGLNNL